MAKTTVTGSGSSWSGTSSKDSVYMPLELKSELVPATIRFITTKAMRQSMREPAMTQSGFIMTKTPQSTREQVTTESAYGVATTHL